MEKKVLYVHGMSSSGSCLTARVIRGVLLKQPDIIELIAPDMSVNPKEALQVLKELCEREKPDLIIGSSMGGMLVQQMFGYKKILINPAFHVSELMRANLGLTAFLSPRKGGVTHYEMTTQMCDECQEIEAHQFDGITEFDKENTYGFFGTNDTVVHCYDEFCRYYKNAIKFVGGHSPRSKDIKELVGTLIIKLLNEECSKQ